MGKQVAHAVVLAGGRSSRMGADKALLTVGGITMLERVVRAAIGAALQVLVVGRNAAPPDWPDDLHVTFLPDEAPAFSGPVAGLLRGLEHVGESVVLLGCDMPLLTSRTIEMLVTAHADSPPPAAATLAVRDFAEPTFSVYTMEMLPRLRKILSGERRGFQWLINEPDIRTWQVPPDIAAQLLNVNDPATLAQAQSAPPPRGGSD